MNAHILQDQKITGRQEETFAKAHSFTEIDEAKNTHRLHQSERR